jgi:hypothetical protein
VVNTPHRPDDDLPAALPEDRREALIDAVRAGGFLRTACDRAGVSHPALVRWGRRWLRGDAEARPLDEFFRKLAAAAADAESESLEQVRGGGKDWRAHVWFLERRYPRRWGRKPAKAKARKPAGNPLIDELRNALDGP